MIQRHMWRWYDGLIRPGKSSSTGGKRETSSISSFGKTIENDSQKKRKKRGGLVDRLMLGRVVPASGLASRSGFGLGFPILSMTLRSFSRLGSGGGTLARTM